MLIAFTIYLIKHDANKKSIFYYKKYMNKERQF